MLTCLVLDLQLPYFAMKCVKQSSVFCLGLTLVFATPLEIQAKNIDWSLVNQPFSELLASKPSFSERRDIRGPICQKREMFNELLPGFFPEVEDVRWVQRHGVRWNIQGRILGLWQLQSMLRDERNLAEPIPQEDRTLVLTKHSFNRYSDFEVVLPEREAQILALFFSPLARSAYKDVLACKRTFFNRISNGVLTLDEAAEIFAFQSAYAFLRSITPLSQSGKGDLNTFAVNFSGKEGFDCIAMTENAERIIQWFKNLGYLEHFRTDGDSFGMAEVAHVQLVVVQERTDEKWVTDLWEVGPNGMPSFEIFSDAVDTYERKHLRKALGEIKGLPFKPSRLMNESK